MIQKEIGLPVYFRSSEQLGSGYQVSRSRRLIFLAEEGLPGKAYYRLFHSHKDPRIYHEEPQLVIAGRNRWKDTPPWPLLRRLGTIYKEQTIAEHIISTKP